MRYLVAKMDIKTFLALNDNPSLILDKNLLIAFLKWESLRNGLNRWQGGIKIDFG